MSEPLFTKKTVAIMIVAVFALSAILFIGGKIVHPSSSPTTQEDTDPHKTVSVSGSVWQDPIGNLSEEGEPSVKDLADRLKASKSFEQAPYPQAPFMVGDKFFSESEEGEKGWGQTQEIVLEKLNEHHTIADIKDLFSLPEMYEQSSNTVITADIGTALQSIGVSPYTILVAYPMGEENTIYIRYVFAPQSMQDTQTWKVDFVETR